MSESFGRPQEWVDCRDHSSQPCLPLCVICIRPCEWGPYDSDDSAYSYEDDDGYCISHLNPVCSSKCQQILNIPDALRVPEGL